MQKREFTSFDVAAVIRELRESIINSRVINIYQLDDKCLLFKLRSRDGRSLALLLEAGRRLNLTSYAQEKPLTPPSFCMALRKHLKGGWIVNVEQYEFERIAVFHFRSGAGNFKLILELFGEGNVILVGEDGKILQALVYKRMRDRNILRSEPFQFPPPAGKNPFKVSKEDLFQGLSGFGDVEVVRALARFLGLGGIYAEEVLLRTGIEKTMRCSSLNHSHAEAMYNCLHEMLLQVTCGTLEPHVILDEAGSLIDVTPLRLKRYDGLMHQAYSSFNEALDEFYSRVAALDKSQAAEERDKEIRREIERLKRVMNEQEKALQEIKQRAERMKRTGDLIYAYSAELQMLLDKFSNAGRCGKSLDEVASEIIESERLSGKPNFSLESLDKGKMLITINAGDLKFQMDLRDDLYSNASRFYEEAKAAKRKLEGVKEALENTRKKIEELEAQLKDIEDEKLVKSAEAFKELAKRRIRQKRWFEKFRWFMSSDGFLVVAGKDAASNEALIKKYTGPGDIVFHADIVGAPFIVVKTEGRSPSEQCLKEAGEFAAALSRGWREGFATVDVYWVYPEQLSKTGETGEYVPRGAFVVRGRRNWMRNMPLRMAVGVSLDEETGSLSFIGGPVDAVKTRTQAYVVVAPGDFEGKELFKRILKELASKVPIEHQKKVLEASLYEVKNLIPYGRGIILSD
ncbi:MAG: ribosome rescue protein RqcH [Candidatus Bathyarchaeota archaeon]|nr:ribosome rescue protein RqcH [Candidatus Bathyarchaeota archaeon]